MEFGNAANACHIFKGQAFGVVLGKILDHSLYVIKRRPVRRYLACGDCGMLLIHLYKKP